MAYYVVMKTKQTLKIKENKMKTMTEKKEHAEKRIVEINEELDSLENEKNITEEMKDRWNKLGRELDSLENILETIKKGR